MECQGGKYCGVGRLFHEYNFLSLFKSSYFHSYQIQIITNDVVIHIPRSQTVQEAEFLAQTVVQAYPDSDQALVYRDLAQRILMNEDVYVPNPIGLDEIKPIIQKYS